MGLSGRHFLLVEDDPLHRDLMLMCLKDAGCRADPVVDAEHAWAALWARPRTYDAVVLDRMLPGMGGLTLLTRIRAEPGLACIPVLLVSARASGREVSEGLKAGASAYLTKPFDNVELLKALERALDAAPIMGRA